MRRLWGFLLLFCLSSLANVLVETDTKPWIAEPTPSELQDNFESQLLSGLWNDAGLLFPVNLGAGIVLPEGAIVERGGIRYLQVNSVILKSLPRELTQRIAAHLASHSEFRGGNDRQMFRAWVNTKDNLLADQSLLVTLTIDIAKLAELEWAKDLLSPYAKRWAHHSPGFNGPNCWHSSIASISPGWTKARYMLPEEFRCHIQTSFEPIEKPEKWGDLIRISTRNEQEIHGFTYLGQDRKVGTRTIVFTKNGYANSPYLFMDLASVAYIYDSPPNLVSFYRMKSVPIDPAVDSHAPCANYYSGDWNGRAKDLNGFVLAGLRAERPEDRPLLHIK